MIPYRVFLPAVGIVATFVMGIVLSLFSATIPAGWAVALIAALALVIVLVAERLVHVADVFEHWEPSARSIAFQLIAAAVVADGAVASAFVVMGLGELPTWLLMLLGLMAVQMALGAAANRYLGRLHPKLLLARQRRAQASKTSTGPNGVQNVLALGEEGVDTSASLNKIDDVIFFRMALKKIKLDWLVVKKTDALFDEDGVPFGRKFEVQIPSEAIADKNKGTLSTDNAERIAVALSEVLNQELEARWVGIQRLKRAGGYTITVAMQDIMARIYPYVDKLEWADIHEPAPIGYGLDAKLVTLLLRQFGQYIGKTRSGKTSLINNTLAYLTRCKNAVVWICGTEKLYDMLAAWLEIYLDTDEEMPFDFVCVGAEDTAECLAALMRIARYRQSLRLHERVGLPDIVCILDEASFALRNGTVTAMFDDRELTMSALCGMLAQGAGSAGCWLQYSTQRDTNDQLGVAGGDIAAQTGFTAAFNSSDGLSIGRLTGDFKLPTLAYKGEFYLKDDDGESYPVAVKGRYMQEDDPSKPHLHDGLTVSQVSWSRREFKTRLDIGSQNEAGELYENRHTKVTTEFLDYLRKVKKPMRVMRTEDVASEAPEYDIKSEAATLATRMGLDFTTMPPDQKEAFIIAAKEMHEDVEPPEDVPTGPTGANRADQIVWILGQWPEPMTSAQIIEALRTYGFEVKSEGAVYNLLGQLVEKGILVKGDDKLYGLPE